MEDKKALQPEELEQVNGGLCAGGQRQRIALAKAIIGTVTATLQGTAVGQEQDGYPHPNRKGDVD